MPGHYLYRGRIFLGKFPPPFFLSVGYFYFYFFCQLSVYMWDVCYFFASGKNDGMHCWILMFFIFAVLRLGQFIDRLL